MTLGASTSLTFVSARIKGEGQSAARRTVEIPVGIKCPVAGAVDDNIEVMADLGAPDDCALFRFSTDHFEEAAVHQLADFLQFLVCDPLIRTL